LNRVNRQRSPGFSSSTSGLFQDFLTCDIFTRSHHRPELTDAPAPDAMAGAEARGVVLQIVDLKLAGGAVDSQHPIEPVM
jgi:hypothetical protein